MDLSTTYLGLKLKNPLVPSASPLSRELGTLRQLEDAGASAIDRVRALRSESLVRLPASWALLASQ